MVNMRPHLLKMYLSDRRGFICVYLVGLLLTALVLVLSAGGSDYVATEDLLYGLSLSVGLLVAYIGFDYARHRPFLESVAGILRSDAEDYAIPADPASGEHAMFRDALAANLARFREALAKYKRAEELHRRFADRWVHHMKTPVSVVKLLVGQLSDCPEAQSDRVRKIVRSLDEENERLQRGLDTFLNSARLEGFDKDLHVEEVNLVEVARESLNAHKSQLISSYVFPKLEVNSNSLQVVTDRKWLRFVLDQLITNAIKYSSVCRTDAPDGAVASSAKTISIVITADDAKRRLSVSDEGIGIPPEDIPRVFDPFFTGRNGRLVPESTGMGLYLVRQVLSRLGHAIEVDSQLGCGTCFTITFSSASIADVVLRR